MADVYVDVAQDGTVVTSSVGAGDKAVYFGGQRAELGAEGNSVRACNFGPGFNVAVVGGQDNNAYYIESTIGATWTRLGPCFGRRSVAVARGQDGSVLIAIVRRNGVYELLRNFQSQGEWLAPLGGLGIIDLLPNGDPIFVADPAIDAPRQMTRNGLLVNNWCERGGVFAGLLLGLGDQLVVFDDNGPRTAALGKVFEPHLTALNNGDVVLSYRTLGGYGVKYSTDWESFQFQIEPLGKKAIGVIYGSSERFGYGVFPGNCEVLFGSDPPFGPSSWYQMRLARPVIAGAGAIVPEAHVLGTWHDTRFSTFPLEGPRPHFLYDEAQGELHDGRGDVLLVQCYPKWNEPPAVFHGRMVGALIAHPVRRKILVAKFYPGNPPEAFTEAQLVPYFAVYEALLRRPDVDGLLAFDGLRSGLKPGINPIWHAAFRAFAEASSGLPEFSVVPQSELKRVVIDVETWTLNELKPGRKFVGRDTANPELGTRCAVWIKPNGSMHMEIDYPGADPTEALAGETGAFRPVKQ